MAQQTIAKKSLSTAVEIWDLYCSGDYNKIEEKSREYLKENSQETADLISLAMLEIKPGSVAGTHGKDTGGLFAPLLSGMLSYLRSDFIHAAETLGDWLLVRDYYNHLILSRFSDAAVKSARYPLLLKVFDKFSDNKSYYEILTGPALIGYSETGKFKEALQLWNKSGSAVKDPNHVQKAAFALMDKAQYKDAEKILLDLYQRITGHPYQLDYMAVKARYKDSLKKLASGSKVKEDDYESMMELGMAYLFNEEYAKARSIFEKLQQKFS